MKIPLLYSQVDYSDIDSRTDINEYEKSRLRNIKRLKACELYIDLQHQLAICTEIKAEASVKPKRSRAPRQPQEPLPLREQRHRPAKANISYTEPDSPTELHRKVSRMGKRAASEPAQFAVSEETTWEDILDFKDADPDVSISTHVPLQLMPGTI
jgi:hypothetical protein